MEFRIKLMVVIDIKHKIAIRIKVINIKPLDQLNTRLVTIMIVSQINLIIIIFLLYY